MSFPPMSRFLVITSEKLSQIHPSANKDLALRFHSVLTGALWWVQTLAKAEFGHLQFVVLRASNDGQLGQLSSEFTVVLGHCRWKQWVLKRSTDDEKPHVDWIDKAVFFPRFKNFKSHNKSGTTSQHRQPELWTGNCKVGGELVRRYQVKSCSNFSFL